MHFVTIPFNDEELPEPARATVIPICIARNDQAGEPIAWGGSKRSRAFQTGYSAWRDACAIHGAHLNCPKRRSTRCGTFMAKISVADRKASCTHTQPGTPRISRLAPGISAAAS